MSLHGVLEGENHNHKIAFVSSNIPPDTIQSILDTIQVSWRIKLFSKKEKSIDNAIQRIRKKILIELQNKV